MSQDAEVTVCFKTKLKDELRVTEAPFAVPSRLTRLGLSEVINHLLDRESSSISFDFIVDGELVRTSLHKVMEQKLLSMESVVEIEYVQLHEEPELDGSSEHDDWISGIAAFRNVAVTGSYDKSVRVWASDGKKLAEVRGHTAPIKSVAVAPWPVAGSSSAMVVSASKDCTLRCTQLTVDSKGKSATVKDAGVCEGHTGSVDTVAFSPEGCAKPMFVSGSWDSAVCIWDAAAVAGGGAAPSGEAMDDGEEAGKSRKRKVAPSAAFAPSFTLQAHTQAITGVCWPRESTLISSGMDHCVKMWDVETCTPMLTMTSTTAALCLAARSETLIATGHADNSVRIWDPRASSTLLQKTLNSHKGWIVGAAWSPLDDNLLLTTSYDLTSKLWDIRSTVPLFTMRQHDDKVLCCSWQLLAAAAAGEDSTQRALTGGADGTMYTFKSA